MLQTGQAVTEIDRWVLRLASSPRALGQGAIRSAGSAAAILFSAGGRAGQVTCWLLLMVLLLTGGRPLIAAADCATQTQIPESECNALMALYTTTNGPGWTNNAGWDVPEKPCGFIGVACSNGHVTGVSLVAINLTGSIPAEIGSLSRLTDLSLNFNQLSGSIPAEIGNLSQLTWLNLSDNQLSGTIPAEIGNLSQLQSLWLNSNQLSGTIPTEIGNLSQLDELALSNNQLSGTIPTEIGNLSQLNQLYLSFNQLSGTIPAEIGNLSQLTRLNLSDNQLSGTIPAEIGNLSQLEVLSLSRDQLSGTIPAEIGNLSQLTWLDLFVNQLSGTIPAEIGNLSQLQRLWLNSNQLSGTIPTEIGNLSQLDTLALSNNQLSGTIPAEIGNLSQLGYFWLDNNQLSNTIPAEIGNLSQLNQLDLSVNQLSGSIPAEIGNLSQLTWLNLSDNQLSGTIPAEIGTLSQLTSISLFKNQLSGTVPLCVAERGAAAAWCSFISNDASLCLPKTPEYQALGKDPLCELPLSSSCPPLVGTTATTAQAPMSGPPGTTFVQWGTGFTPNSTGILHVQKPDGSEYPTQQQPMDAIGHFEIEYTASQSKPPGLYTWWVTDGVTGQDSNKVTYEITNWMPIKPVIAQTPETAPPGATLAQWGTGFTPNSTGTLHVQKPDGSEYPTQQQPMDATGHFDIRYTVPPDKPLGKYKWWVVDGPTGIGSNPVYYEITSIPITAAAYDVTNLETVANQFQIWMNVSINGAPATDSFCNDFSVVVQPGTQSSGLSNLDNPTCAYIDQKDGHGRFRIGFQMRSPSGGPEPVWFENATVYVKSKSGLYADKKVEGLGTFSVYGTNFDIETHAWQFKNSSWNKEKLDKDILKAADITNNYISKLSIPGFWYALNYGGLCYGMAHVGISNFNNKDEDAWGTRSVDYWEDDIDSHWPTTANQVVNDFKPLPTDNIYSLEWDLQSAKKIMYYFVTQPTYKDLAIDFTSKDNWEGKDNLKDIDNSTRPLLVNLLKAGKAVPFNLPSEHTISISQLTSWRGMDYYILWDNNGPIDITQENDYWPNLLWRVTNSSNYDNSYTDTIYKLKQVESYYSEEEKYKLKRRPQFLDPDFDSQNIYSIRDESTSQSLGVTTLKTNDTVPLEAQEAGDTPSNYTGYELTDRIQIQIIGGKVDGVFNRDTGESIRLVPNGDFEAGQSVISSSSGESFHYITLQPDKQYRVTATKLPDVPFLKVFLSVPAANGALQKMVYDTLQFSETDATRITFFVGVGNTDVNVQRSTGASPLPVQDTSGTDASYPPDYQQTLSTVVGPPDHFTATHTATQVQLSWVNSTHPNFSKVRIVRKFESFPESATDGVVVYEGAGTATVDDNVVPGAVYYYGIFSVSNTGEFSSPATALVNMLMYSIKGRVTKEGAVGLPDVEVKLINADGGDFGSTATGPDGAYTLMNVPMGQYSVAPELFGFDFLDTPRQITLGNANQTADFAATSKPAVGLLFDLLEAPLGKTLDVPWRYRHIGDDQRVNITLYRNGAWETLASNVPILNGLIRWKVLGALTDQAILRVTLASDPAVFDEHTFKVVYALYTDFSADPTHGLAPMTVQFSDLSNGTVNSWLWQFGDGGTSTAKNPAHFFSVAGAYNVSLTVTRPEGSQEETKYQYITTSVGADSDFDGIADHIEVASCTDALDADTDDDGITDGDEDKNHNGKVDTGETDPCNADTDNDGIQDGTELGVTLPVPDPDGAEGALLGTDTTKFQPDMDPATNTDPLNADMDGDGVKDGDEDTNHNGRVDAGETDPAVKDAKTASPVFFPVKGKDGKTTIISID